MYLKHKLTIVTICALFLLSLINTRCQHGIFQPEAIESVDGFQGILKTNQGIYVVVKPDNSLWVWGNNEYGTLGNGSTISSEKPICTNIGSVVAIDLWNSCIIAADTAGDIWYWGHPEIFWTQNVLIPTKIAHIDNVKDIVMNAGKAYVLDENGSIWYLTFQYPNQEPFSGWIEPELLINIPGAVALTEYIALLENGTAMAYDYLSPLQGGLQDTIPEIYAVATYRGSHSVIVKNDGSIWQWGKIIQANGTNLSTTQPVLFPELEDAIVIDVAAHNNIGLKRDGTAWYWGYVSPYPKRISKITNIVSIAMGIISGTYDFEALIKQENGTYWIYKSVSQCLIPVIWD